MNYALFITALVGLILFVGGVYGLCFESEIKVTIVFAICLITGILLMIGSMYIESSDKDAINYISISENSNNITVSYEIDDEKTLVNLSTYRISKTKDEAYVEIYEGSYTLCLPEETADEIEDALAEGMDKTWTFNSNPQ